MRESSLLLCLILAFFGWLYVSFCIENTHSTTNAAIHNNKIKKNNIDNRINMKDSVKKNVKKKIKKVCIALHTVLTADMPDFIKKIERKGSI